MKTILEVTKLRVRAFHGVFRQERKVGNTFLVSVGVEADIDIPTDSIDGTINYAELIEVIKTQMAEPSALIEHAAWRIMGAITKRWPSAERGYVKVEKPNPPLRDEIESASITVKW